MEDRNWIHDVYPMDIHRGPTLKTAQFRIRVEPSLLRAFLKICCETDESAAHVLRTFMRSYVENRESAKQTDLFVGGYEINNRKDDR